MGGTAAAAVEIMTGLSVEVPSLQAPNFSRSGYSAVPILWEQDCLMTEIVAVLDDH